MAELADLRAQLQALLTGLDAPAPASDQPQEPVTAGAAAAVTADSHTDPVRLGQLVVHDGRYGLVVDAGVELERPYCLIVWLVGPHERVPAGRVKAVS
jgi:hypothetical protein